MFISSIEHSVPRIINSVMKLKLQRIRDLREDADLSQEEMGKAIHLGQRTYAYYESGGRALPIEVLIDIAKFHNTTTDYILGLTDNREKPY